MRIKTAVVAGLMSAAVGFASHAGAAVVQWKVADGGNGHYYQRIDSTNRTYAQSKFNAENSFYGGIQGRLAVLETSTYEAERDFIASNVYIPSLPSNGVYLLGVTRAAGNTENPTEGWTWEDGQAVPTPVSSTWAIDFNEGDVPQTAGFFGGDSFSLYDVEQTDVFDFHAGWIVEYQIAPVPEPIAATTLGGAIVILARRRRGTVA